MPETGTSPHIVMLFGRPGVGKLTIAEYLTAEGLIHSVINPCGSELSLDAGANGYTFCR